MKKNFPRSQGSLAPWFLLSSFQFAKAHPYLSAVGFLSLGSVLVGTAYWFSTPLSRFFSGLFGKGANITINKEGFKKEEITTMVETRDLVATKGNATVQNIATNPSTKTGNITGENVKLDNVDQDTNVDLIRALNSK